MGDALSVPLYPLLVLVDTECGIKLAGEEGSHFTTTLISSCVAAKCCTRPWYA